MSGFKVGYQIMKYKNIFLFIFVVTLSLTLLQLFIRIEINQIAITTKSVDREIFYAERTLLIKELEYQDAYSPKRFIIRHENGPSPRIKCSYFY